MLEDICTIVWKEWKELLVARGSIVNGGWSIILILLVFGIVFPLQVGKEWLSSPIVLLLSAWVPVVLVHTVVADSFAGERERHTLETLLATRLSDHAILFGKLLAMMSYGAGLTVMIVLLALVSTNIAAGSEGILLYAPTIGLGSIVLILLDAMLAAGIGVLVSLRAPTVRQAQQFLSGLNFLLLLIPLVSSRVLSMWGIALTQANLIRGIVFVIAGLALLNVGLIIAATRRFKRARLILD